MTGLVGTPPMATGRAAAAALSSDSRSVRGSKLFTLGSVAAALTAQMSHAAPQSTPASLIRDWDWMRLPARNLYASCKNALFILPLDD
ncbi:hypothetical protein GCM10022631_21800 [Deinococcus rubellus]